MKSVRLRAYNKPPVVDEVPELTREERNDSHLNEHLSPSSVRAHIDGLPPPAVPLRSVAEPVDFTQPGPAESVGLTMPGIGRVAAGIRPTRRGVAIAHR